MKIKDSILLTLKNLLHPAGLIGLVIAIIIPAIIWFLGRPSGGHKEIIRQLDLNLPLPLFLFQMAVAIILFAFLNKDFREWFKGILPQKPFSILAIAAAIGIAVFAEASIFSVIALLIGSMLLAGILASSRPEYRAHPGLETCAVEETDWTDAQQ